MIKNMTALAIAVIMAVSCSKDKDKRDVGEMERLLTTGEWRIESLKHSTGASDGWPVFGTEVCNNDDRYVFTSSKFEVRGGETKCVVSEPEILRSGVWTFMGEGSRLRLYSSPHDKEFEVLQLSSSVMELRVDYEGDVLTYRFVH